MHRRLRFALLVTIAAALILQVVPARADSTAPVLDSVKRISTDKPSPKSSVSVAVSGHDGGGSQLRSINVDYTGPHGHGFSAWVRGSGVASISLDQWVATGHYELTQVWYCDHASNCVHQRRDGSYNWYPKGIPDPKPAPIDFAAHDFDVVNPNEDLYAPTLSDVSLVWHDVVAGTPVVLMYKAHDERSGIRWLFAVYRDPAGKTIEVRSDFIPKLGPAHWLVPLSSPGGTYELLRIGVRDDAENQTTYWVDGTIRPYPSVTTPQHEPPDLGALDFNVIPAKEDRSYPKVNSLERSSPRIARAGEDVVVGFSVSDDWTGVDEVTITWEDQYGHRINAIRTCDVLGDGEASMRLASWWPPGLWQADVVHVKDRHGNRVMLYRSQQALTYPYDPAHPSRHDSDLSQLDFTIEAGEPRSEGLVTLPPCVSIPNVDARPGTPTVDPGADLTLLGNVSKKETAVPEPVVVFYEYEDKVPVALLGVERGDRAGAFAGQTRARRGAEYRVHFLGSDADVPASHAASDFFSATVGRQTSLSLSAPAASTAGSSIPLTAGLTATAGGDGLAGRQIELISHPAGGTDAVVDRQTTDANGVARFTVAPTRTTDYRARFLATKDDVASQSDTKRVEVRNTTTTIDLLGSSITTTGIPAALAATLSIGDTPLAGRRVALDVRYGSGAFRRVATASTGSDGVAGFRVLPDRNAQYRATFAPAGDARPVSDTFSVWVRPRLGLRASASRVQAGTPVTFSATTSPAHPGSRAVLLRRVGNGWRAERWVTLSHSGSAGVTIRSLQGTNRYMFAVPTHGDHIAGYSQIVTIVGSSGRES